MKKTLFLLLNFLLICACGNDKQAPQTPPSPTAEQTAETQKPDDSPAPAPTDEAPAAPTKDLSPAGAAEAVSRPKSPLPPPPVPDAAPSIDRGDFSDVAKLDPSIKMDIRYATADNFTKSKIYDCPRCLLRPAAAKAIVKAHKTLQQKGFGLKMYDCYRPRPYQQRLWDKVPDPDYVTPPAKGSMHSRGAAVDLTVVDKNGKELDMGTPYDFFGPEAHTDNTRLPAQVLANRRLLREALEDVGFKGIRTEWWHFSYQGKDFPLSNYVWPCKE